MHFQFVLHSLSMQHQSRRYSETRVCECDTSLAHTSSDIFLLQLRLLDENDKNWKEMMIEAAINEGERINDVGITSGFVTDEFARFDVTEAGEERSNVVLWHGLRQVVDNEVRTHLRAVLLLLLLLLVRGCGGRRRRRRRRWRWWRWTVNGRRRAVDTAAATQMRLEGHGWLLRLRHGRRALWRRLLWRRTLHVHVHSAGTVDSAAFSAVAGDLPVTNSRLLWWYYRRQVLYRQVIGLNVVNRQSSNNPTEMIPIQWLWWNGPLVTSWTLATIGASVWIHMKNLQ